MLRVRPLVRPLRFVTTPKTHLRPRWGSTSATFSHLNSVTEQDVAHFTKILPETSILSTLGPKATAESELTQYNNDWMGKYHGKSRVVLRPKTTQQVSEIVKYCNERGIGVVPQGGNTGLVGGSVPINDEVVINLGSMSNIRSFDPVSGESCRASSTGIYSECIVTQVFLLLTAAVCWKL
jgi:(R)-2-hydroxyglutarate---pyruvate transhydrogenase